MDATRPRARAVAARNGRILSVGSTAEAEAFRGSGTVVIDARGATMLPGFIESHCHLFLGGAELGDLQLGGVAGAEAATRAMRDHASILMNVPILIAQGADYAIFGHPTTRHDLDAIIPDRPFAMASHDHHTMWANTAALEATGLLRGRATPPGSEVVMGADGLATGELREEPAYRPLGELAGTARATLGLSTGEEPDPPPSQEQRAADLDLLAKAARHLAAHGVTTAVNMDGNRYTLELLRQLSAEGRLPIRVKVAFHFKPHMTLSALDRAEAMRHDFSDDTLSAGLIKMFMDGVIDSGTAVMTEDYPDQPGWRGEPLFGPDQFNQIAVEADRRGFQIAVHAIGDGAVRRVIDGYDAARRENGPRDSRHRIEHIELIHEDDRPRLRSLGITASVQPPHPPGAMDFPLEPTQSRISRHRWPDAYRWRTLDTHLAFASDWPVADVSVLRGIQAALTREPWCEGLQDERVGLVPTLRAYTVDGAWAAHLEDRVGCLREGMLADMVLLDGDIEATAPQAIGSLRIRATICNGRVTHRSDPN